MAVRRIEAANRSESLWLKRALKEAGVTPEQFVRQIALHVVAQRFQRGEPVVRIPPQPRVPVRRVRPAEKRVFVRKPVVEAKPVAPALQKVFEKETAPVPKKEASPEPKQLFPPVTRPPRVDEAVHKAPLRDAFGYYLKDLSSYPVLSPEAQRALAEKARQGDVESAQKLVLHNLRLVLPIAKRYIRGGISLQDLVQEGNLGLMRAARTYDPSLAQFSTYSTYWIRQSIARAVMDRLGRTIRLPIPTHLQLQELGKAREKILEVGHIPTLADLRAETGFSKETLLRLLDAEKHVFSLDKPLYEDEDTSFYNVVPSNVPTPEEISSVTSDRRSIEAVLKKMRPDHAAVIRARFGFPYEGTHEKGTLEHSVNKLLEKEPDGVTLEKVGQKLGRLLRTQKFTSALSRNELQGMQSKRRTREAIRRAQRGTRYKGRFKPGTLKHAVNEFIKKNPRGAKLKTIGMELGPTLRKAKYTKPVTRERVRQIEEEALSILGQRYKKGYYPKEPKKE